MPEQKIDAIWVVSDVAPDGTYVTTIQAGPDRAVTLDRTGAVAYAMAVIQTVVYAEYDAAVIAQLTFTGLSIQAAAAAVGDLRADRPPVDPVTTGPLTFEPLVTAAKREPAVFVALDGERIAQWTAEEAKGHALQVLEVVAAVDQDAAYYRYLRGSIGLDEGRARDVVGDLGQHRSGGDNG